MRNAYSVFMGKLEGKRPLEIRSVVGKIILRRILNE
jgi:hypothetical protein